MSESFDLSEVQRITVSAVGEPGQRLFVLQARQGGQLVTLKLEKIQVAALAAWIVKTLHDAPAAVELPEDLEHEPFAEPDWTVGSLGGNYDIEADRVVLVAAELTEDIEAAGADDAEELTTSQGAVAHFRASREQMAALAIRATQLVNAGRPPCPFCGYPLDPSGHACPKTNGHRPPQL